jgi:hypothetical protein
MLQIRRRDKLKVATLQDKTPLKYAWLRHLPRVFPARFWGRITINETKKTSYFIDYTSAVQF